MLSCCVRLNRPSVLALSPPDACPHLGGIRTKRGMVFLGRSLPARRWELRAHRGRRPPPHRSDFAPMRVIGTKRTGVPPTKANSVTNIRSGPSASAEIIGIAPAGAEVQVGWRNSGWVQIIDPWSLRTGWIHSQFLAPSNTLSAPAGSIMG